ncbi:MAG TPA: glycine cleavage system protein GcvH [Chiayiivirga sp.]|nr:glycine cleavage system protein GcvH [Chiayiivirga sp.]
MSDIPGDLKFMRSHEWARLEDGGRVVVGISDHAQDQLGDLVYVELPNVGDHLDQGASSAVLESVKAASDIYAPVSGTVLEINDALSDAPDTINNDAWGEGWLFVLKADDASQLDALLSPDEYAAHVESGEH